MNRAIEILKIALGKSNNKMASEMVVVGAFAGKNPCNDLYRIGGTLYAVKPGNDVKLSEIISRNINILERYK